MAKHVVDIDEDALRAAGAHLATKTIHATVNEALRRAATPRAKTVAQALDTLARVKHEPRDNAWG